MLFYDFLLSGYIDNPILLKVKNKQYSYLEIVERTHFLIKELRNASIRKGECVIILMENGFQAICLQLACSKLGIIYVPVSPYEPLDRIEKIITRYKAASVFIERNNITHHDIFIDGYSFCDVASDNIFRSNSIGNVEQEEDIVDSVTEDDILYIISTSGTTGNPKGIPMTHKSVICFFQGLINHCNIDQADNVGSIAPLQFDLSLLDLGLAWGSKACLSIFSQTLAYTPKKLIDEIARMNVTQFHSVPTVWSMIIGSAPEKIGILTGLKAILYAGDKFPVKNMMLLQKKLPQLKIINCFGPTECIAFSFYDIPKILSVESSISIGKGYPGNIFYLVDSSENLIKNENVIGELWISNGALFKGYWENEILSKEKLIKDTFNNLNHNMVYKTGDLMSRDLDGNYYFHGRKDTQIKIHGNRVELDEIEQVALEFDGVIDAVAIFDNSNENSKIYLFIYSTNERQVNEETIRNHCRLKLPIYMLPNKVIITLKPMPVNANGKINRKNLINQFVNVQ
jgi:amino acid adenylation domain-containing protein